MLARTVAGRTLVLVLFVEAARTDAQATAQSVYLGRATYLEIDRRPDTACAGGAPDGNCAVDETPEGCPTDCELAADANLFVGFDPADGTTSVSRPPCSAGSCTFRDWDDLDPARHRVLDIFFNTQDTSSFPQSNACIAPALNPPKQELTYSGVANNLEYGYFVVKRFTGNGDSAYFWLVTRVAPTFTPGPVSYTDLSGATQSCSVGQSLLTYDLSTGDLLLVGEFEPSSTATVLRVFQASAPYADLDAQSATHFPALVAAGILVEQPPGVALGTVNTTPTAAGSWATPPSTALESPALIAEAALPLALFPGEVTACGRTYHASLLSKPSTSPASDLKDLIPPFAFTLDGCPAEAPICTGAFECAGCQNDGECEGEDPSLPACQPGGRCGQCSATQTALCVDPVPLCDADRGICVECLSAADCPPESPICHGATRACVASSIFAHGLESGSTSAWSATHP